jgi:hypothetical protein
VRYDDELGTVRKAPQELDEAADVRVVERGFDLVQQIERARSREEESEQERDCAERLLAAGEKREAGDALASGLKLDLDPGLLAVFLRGHEPSAATREERSCNLREVSLDRGVGLAEALVDGRGEIVAELRDLGERLLQVLALTGKLLEPRLFLLVLLSVERILLAMRLPPTLVTLDLGTELLDLFFAQSLGSIAFGETLEKLGLLSLEPGGLYANGS